MLSYSLVFVLSLPLKYQMLTSVMPKQAWSRLSVYAFALRASLALWVFVVSINPPIH